MVQSLNKPWQKQRKMALRSQYEDFKKVMVIKTSLGTYVTKNEILLHYGNSALTPMEPAIEAPTGDHYLLPTNFYKTIRKIADENELE